MIAFASSYHADQELVDFASHLADEAGKITRQQPLDVESKHDASPVTVADREAEARVRELIRNRFPAHGIFGEEEGMQSGNEYLWVIDPIDGTKSFITGAPNMSKPLFGTLIALLHEGTPVLGIIDQPVIGDRWIGAAGRPTTFNGGECRVRPCETIGAAYLYATTPHMFAGAAEAAFARVRDQARTPLYGCDCYAYGLLASGWCDLMVEADLKPYDYLALVPIVQGAGGRMTDWTGAELTWPMTPSHTYALDELPGEVVAAGDARVHAEALDLLKWSDGSDDRPEDIRFQTSTR